MKRLMGALLVFVASGVASVPHVGCRRTPGGEAPPTPQPRAAKPFDAYPVVPLQPARTGTARVLIDVSGSMAGHAEVMPQLTSWLGDSVSYLRQSYGFSPTPLESCTFSLSAGVRCSSGSPAGVTKTFGGDTNLAEAIRRAGGADLGIVLTDGVAASGSKPVPGCADGVDAACVARALRSFIRPDDGYVAGRNPGVWLLTIETPFKGTYFSERRADPSALNEQAVVTRIHEIVGGQPSISKKTVFKDGTLGFRYEGPRTLLVLVLARDVNVGRLAVAALRTTVSKNGFKDQELPAVAAGIAIGPSFELYPGWLAPLEWNDLQEDQEQEASGTIDVYLRAPGALQIACDPTGRHQQRYTLLGYRSEAAGAVNYLPLRSLPEGRPRFTGPELGRAVVESRLSIDKGRGVLRADLQIACDATMPRGDCAKATGTELVLDYLFDYAATAQTFARRGGSPFEAVSTEDPVSFPDRVFALDNLLQSFYEQVAAQSSSTRLGALTVCRETER